MPRALVRLFVALGSLVLGPACGPMVILEEGSESDDESAGDSEASSSTTAATSTTTTATTTPPDPTTVSTTTPPDPTGREPGYCAQICSVVDDCVPPGTSLDGWACIDGFCEWNGQFPPCDETICPAELGGACASVEGIVQCVFLCTAGGRECDILGLECIGVTDEGLLHCLVPPCSGAAEGEPCEIPGFGQYGVCTDGVCVCTDDAQCTAEGLACNQ